MAKKNNKLMEYNKACAAAGLTYAQMQQKETHLLCERRRERMLQSRIPSERVSEEEMRKL